MKLINYRHLNVLDLHSLSIHQLECHAPFFYTLCKREPECPPCGLAFSMNGHEGLNHLAHTIEERHTMRGGGPDSAD